MAISLTDLQETINSAAAIRLRQKLQSEGDAGDKVFPPTYAGGTYCWEQRRIDGQSVPCVLLDSVASQANRLEEALTDAITKFDIELPRLTVTFDGDLADIGEISTLAAPHRVFDAILRDSALDGTPFFKSALYKALTASHVRNATELFASSPNALLFGCWDSTGAAGGLGNKFARAITSEIIGVNADWGSTQGGIRQDPLGISADAEIAIDANGEWSLIGKSATGKKERAKGTRPSEINHGNVLVKVETTADRKGMFSDELVLQRLPLKGGVTVDYALQITVLSLTGLRRLKFPLASGASEVADHAAQAVLAALGLVAITVSRERGYWLRSRCALVAEGAQDLEIVHADGHATPLSLDSKQAVELYKQAIVDARKIGLPWHAEPVALTPQPKLADLVRKSREIQSLGG